MFCDQTNLTAPTGECAAGYYCTTGVNTATPSGSNTGTGNICTTGHYCEARTILPQECEAGTYQVELYNIIIHSYVHGLQIVFVGE